MTKLLISEHVTVLTRNLIEYKCVFTHMLIPLRQRAEANAGLVRPSFASLISLGRVRSVKVKLAALVLRNLDRLTALPG